MVSYALLFLPAFAEIYTAGRRRSEPAHEHCIQPLFRRRRRPRGRRRHRQQGRRDVRKCCFGLGDPLIMLLKATRERRKERKRSSKDRKERREGGRAQIHDRAHLRKLLVAPIGRLRTLHFLCPTPGEIPFEDVTCRVLKKRVLWNASTSFIASNLQSNASLKGAKKKNLGKRKVGRMRSPSQSL